MILGEDKVPTPFQPHNPAVAVQKGRGVGLSTVIIGASSEMKAAMAKGDRLFWVAPVDFACEQILRAIRRRQKHAYVTQRWRLIAWLLRLLPEWAYNRL